MFDVDDPLRSCHYQHVDRATSTVAAISDCRGGGAITGFVSPGKEDSKDEPDGDADGQGGAFEIAPLTLGQKRLVDALQLR